MAEAASDINILLRDASAGMREWWLSLCELRDNPLYQYLNRNWTRRSRSNRWHRFFMWLPPLLSVTGLGYVMLRFVTATTASVVHDPRILAVLLTAGALCILWLISGLYHTARDSLLLLASRDCLGPSDVHFDEAVMAARLTDRDFIVAMVANILPRLYLRFATAPLFAFIGLILLQLWMIILNQANEGAGVALKVFGLDAATLDFNTLQIMATHLPISLLTLMLLMIPAALVMLLWLLALGRNMHQRWQIQLVALSVSVSQVVWIPLSFLQLFCWLRFNLGEISASEMFTAVLMPFFVVGILVATLHISKRLAGLRYALCAATPVLGLLAPAVVLGMSGMKFLSMHAHLYNAANVMTWITSCFALVNPIGLVSTYSTGLDSVITVSMQAFDWFRLPVILLVQLVCLAVCAHAARLAIADWRTAEV